MTSTKIPHKYAAIERIEKPHPGHRLITLTDRTAFQVGGDAEIFYRDLSIGDLVLIDLRNFYSETQPDVAILYAFRARTDSFGMNQLGHIALGRDCFEFLD